MYKSDKFRGRLISDVSQFYFVELTRQGSLNADGDTIQRGNHEIIVVQKKIIYGLGRFEQTPIDTKITIGTIFKYWCLVSIDCYYSMNT